MNASRADLDCLQSKLKAAIMNHALLVRRMQVDPQNVLAQKELRAVQSEITTLSEKQKLLVQELKKEVEIKRMAGITPQPAHMGSAIQKPPLFEQLPDKHMPLLYADIQPTNLCVRSTSATQLPTSSKRFTPICPAPQVSRPTLPTTGPQAPINFSMQQTQVGLPKPSPSVVVPNSSVNNTLSSQTVTNPKGGAIVPNSSVNNTLSSQTVINPKGGVFYPPAVTSTASNTSISSSPLKTATSQSAIRVPCYNLQPKTNSAQSSNFRPILPKSGSSSHTKRNASVAAATVASDSAANAASPTADKKKAGVEKKEPDSEEKQKLDFLGYLGLVPQDSIKDLLGRRSERKKRSTASSQFYYGNFEIDRRKMASSVADAEVVAKKKGRIHSRPVTPESNTSSSPNSKVKTPEPTDKPDFHDDICAVCHQPGELLMCDTCTLVYHLRCLSPPLSSIPLGNWSCPRCLAKDVISDCNLNGTSNHIDCVIEANKQSSVVDTKEVEQKQIKAQNEQLMKEKAILEKKSEQCSKALKERMACNTDLAQSNASARQCIDKIKSFIEGPSPTTSA